MEGEELVYDTLCPQLSRLKEAFLNSNEACSWNENSGASYFFYFPRRAYAGCADVDHRVKDDAVIF